MATSPRFLWNRVLAVALAFAAAGCGKLYQKAVYDTVTLTGPASGKYSRLMTGEQYLGSQIQHHSVADVYIRLPDGTVYELPNLPEKDVAQRARPRDPDADPSGFTLYHLMPSNSTFHFRNGELVGACLADGIELGKNEKGPYFALPLSTEQVRDLLGKPKKETTFRGPPW